MMRRGFTLIEVMLALFVTALVVTMAYGAMQGGLDTGTRLTAVRAGIEERAGAREVLANALRHAVPGVTGGPPVFELTDSLGPDGLPHDRLRFLTRGVVPPLGAGDAWAVSVVSDAHVVLDASTTAPREDGRLRGVFRGARGFDVRVLGAGHAARWMDRWDDPGLSPTAVSITFVGADGLPDGPPLVVRSTMETRPEGER